MPYPKPYQLHLIGGGPRHNLVLIHSLAGYSSQTATLVVCPRNTIYFNGSVSRIPPLGSTTFPLGSTTTKYGWLHRSLDRVRKWHEPEMTRFL
jgi:hypothetical protein